MISGTEAKVCEDIAKRQQLGIAKYGKTVEGNHLPLRAWMQHAYEEALDLAIYLRRAMDEPADYVTLDDYRELKRKYIEAAFDAEYYKMKCDKEAK
jgi:ribonuclease I